jgi:uncharacterized protein YpmS
MLPVQSVPPYADQRNVSTEISTQMLFIFEEIVFPPFILASRILKYNEENHIISNHQAGFRPSFRTTEQMQVLNTLINKYIRSKKKNKYASFIDFRKAFIRCMLHNYNVSSIIPEIIIKFRQVVMEELHRNDYFAMKQWMLCK